MVNQNEIKEILYNISKNIIIPSFGNLKENQISFKNGLDIVTEVDIAVELELKKQLSKLLNNTYFIGEETFSKDPSILKNYSSDNYCWTVDPIDGTKNFVNSKERFAVMVGLTKKNKIKQTFIYKPISEEFIYAGSNGTFINDKKLILKKETQIENAIGSVSSKYWSENKKIKIKEIKNFFEKIDSYGSIGCEYLDIALGLRNFALLSRLYPWDHIPGVFIVRQAGGHDCHFDKLGYKFYEHSNNLVVSNSKNLNYKILSLMEDE